LRKLARDGELPPLLVMWISGLQCYVVLDGHDRLQAAVLEGTTPHALGLNGLREEPLTLTTAHQMQAERIAATLGSIPRGGRPYSVDSINRVLIEAFDDRPRVEVVTRAWPLTGGSASWMNQVRSQLARVFNADPGMID